MRDPERIQRILGKLYTAWLLSPDQRLGQLLLNLSNELTKPKGELWGSYDDAGNIWHIEDDKWEELLDNFILTGKFADTV